jgi:hypothetical protein
MEIMKYLHQSKERKVYTAPVSFFVIGVAVGMVLMMILFRYFESGIKSWGGSSWASFPLLVIYLSFGAFAWTKFKRDFSQLLNRE